MQTQVLGPKTKPCGTGSVVPLFPSTKPGNHTTWQRNSSLPSLSQPAAGTGEKQEELFLCWPPPHTCLLLLDPHLCRPHIDKATLPLLLPQNQFHLP